MSDDPSPKYARVAAICLLIAAALVVVLRLLGRKLVCECGGGFWAGDVHGPHMSQHVLDPYSATHVLHGVLLYGLLAWAAPRRSLPWRLAWTTAIEAGWEVLENTNFVIERYRTATIAVGYVGDTVVNSLADVACCALGFVIARRFGLFGSIAFVIVVELMLLFWIRDNLTLNVLMLFAPLESLKVWQAGA